MVSIQVVYILYALSVGNLPSLTALSVYGTPADCQAALATMAPALMPDEGGVKLLCLSSDAVKSLADQAGV